MTFSRFLIVSTCLALVGLLASVLVYRALMDVGEMYEALWPEGFFVEPATPGLRNVAYTEQCERCSASYVVDAMEVVRSGAIRIHVTIRNTGPAASVFYTSGFAFSLHWIDKGLYATDMDKARAEGRLSSVLHSRAARTFAFTPHSLPPPIKQGEEWSGWLEYAPPSGSNSDRYYGWVDGDALVIELIAAPGSGHSDWISSQPGHPYITMTGP